MQHTRLFFDLAKLIVPISNEIPPTSKLTERLVMNNFYWLKMKN